MNFKIKAHKHRKSNYSQYLFQALLLSVDYFTLWLNVSLFDSIAEISRLHFVGGSLKTGKKINRSQSEIGRASCRERVDRKSVV